jgi:hypothetical protein
MYLVLMTSGSVYTKKKKGHTNLNYTYHDRQHQGSSIKHYCMEAW